MSVGLVPVFCNYNMFLYLCPCLIGKLAFKGMELTSLANWGLQPSFSACINMGFMAQKLWSTQHGSHDLSVEAKACKVAFFFLYIYWWAKWLYVNQMNLDEIGLTSSMAAALIKRQVMNERLGTLYGEVVQVTVHHNLWIS